MTAIQSMTGFSRVDGHDDSVSWVWEVKSVNNRGLDIRCRIPQGYEAIEQPARESVGSRFRRGSIYVNLSVQHGDSTPRMRLNEDLLTQIPELLGTLRARVGGEPPRLDGLLSLRGLLEPEADEPTEEVLSSRRRAMLSDLDEALAALESARTAEGGRIEAALRDHLSMVAALASEARGLAATQPDALKKRLYDQVSALLAASAGFDENRLAQEAALLAARADIREELDRLDAHLQQARELLAEAQAIGRRLDFLCQEFNREANTLCSKSTDIALTRVGLALKAAVEQFREQVQNIE
ncbi:MAG: YicC/YloC family endoribonuclease [Acetobacterales bacterium]